MNPMRVLAAALAALLLTTGAAAFGGALPTEPPTPAAAAPAVPTGLAITDLKVGRGDPVQAGMSVRVHYTGWLSDPKAREGKGRKFDSSHDRGAPFVFELGAGHVIRGWDLGVAGMRAGGKRRLLIAPELGYGAQGAGDVIPPNSTLLFEIELLAPAPAT